MACSRCDQISRNGSPSSALSSNITEISRSAPLAARSRSSRSEVIGSVANVLGMDITSSVEQALLECLVLPEIGDDQSERVDRDQLVLNSIPKGIDKADRRELLL